MDPDAPRERRRMVMTLCIADWAIEWLRPLPPSYKLIGAVLPEPARPLPADLEVGPLRLRVLPKNLPINYVRTSGLFKT